MALKNYLILMITAVILGLAGWGAVAINTNPTNAGWLTFLLFYATLFFTTSAALSVVGLVARMFFVRQESIIRHAGTALRQAMLFSVLIIAALILKSQGLFNWWLTLILIVVLALLEFFFLSIKKPDPKYPN